MNLFFFESHPVRETMSGLDDFHLNPSWSILFQVVQTSSQWEESSEQGSPKLPLSSISSYFFVIGNVSWSYILLMQ